MPLPFKVKKRTTLNIKIVAIKTGSLELLPYLHQILRSKKWQKEIQIQISETLISTKQGLTQLQSQHNHNHNQKLIIRWKITWNQKEESKGKNDHHPFTKECTSDDEGNIDGVPTHNQSVEPFPKPSPTSRSHRRRHCFPLSLFLSPPPSSKP